MELNAFFSSRGGEMVQETPEEDPGATIAQASQTEGNMLGNSPQTLTLGGST